MATSTRRGKVATSPNARRPWAVRIRPCAAAPMVPGTRRGPSSPTTAAMGRSASSVSKRANQAGKVSAAPRAVGQSASLNGFSAGGGATSKRTAYALTQSSMASAWPSWPSTSAAIGPWFDRPNRPNSGAVAAKPSAWSSRGWRPMGPVCRPDVAWRFPLIRPAGPGVHRVASDRPHPVD